MIEAHWRIAGWPTTSVTGTTTHIVHPWESMSPAPADRLIAAGGEGIYLIDAEGRRFIDGPGGMWNMQLGYGVREMAEAIAGASNEPSLSESLGVHIRGLGEACSKTRGAFTRRSQFGVFHDRRLDRQ